MSRNIRYHVLIFFLLGRGVNTEGKAWGDVGSVDKIVKSSERFQDGIVFRSALGAAGLSWNSLDLVNNGKTRYFIEMNDASIPCHNRTKHV
jgi:hypothetical protein